jgi:hypothetical protein
MISVTADLQSVVEELYGAPPADFTRLRTEAAKLARTSGNKELAEAIAKLRKPSRSAWVLNQLVRAQPEAVEQLLTLGEQLREAEKNLQGAELRRLSLQRGEAVEALVQSALRAAEITAPDADLRREIEETLAAALAEPTVADSLRTGALVKPAAWSGFGVAPPEDLAAVPPRPRQPAPPAEAGAHVPAQDRGDRERPAKVEAAEQRLAEAEAALAEAEHEVVATEREVKRLRKELEAAQETYERASHAASTAQKRVEHARAQLTKLTVGRR